MSQTEIDKFVESEVIEINGKFFIAKEKATTMLVDFAKQEIEKETAELRQQAEKQRDDFYELEVAYKEKIEELEKTISLMRTEAPEVWGRMEDQVKELKENKVTIQSLQEDKEKLKECLVNDNTVNEARIQSLSDRNKELEDGINNLLNVLPKGFARAHYFAKKEIYELEFLLTK